MDSGESLDAHPMKLAVVAMAKRDGMSVVRWLHPGAGHSSAADMMSYDSALARARLARAIEASDHREVDVIMPRTRFPRGPGFRAALMRTACEASRFTKWWESDFALYASAKAADTWGTARITYINRPLVIQLQAASDIGDSHARTLGEWVAGHKRAIAHALNPISLPD